MLTIKQPATYGFKSAHDLPTPPSTSRPSPPLAIQDQALPNLPRNFAPRSSGSPSLQLMSAPLRGLPPPAAMTAPHQAPPPPPPPQGHQHQQQHQHQHPPPPPPPHQMHQGHHGHQGQPHGQAPPAPTTPSSAGQAQYFGQLPPPPPWQQGSDESWRHWLQAKGEEERRRQEEEKRRQEEERTRQESLRLEQRKVEQEMLRHSLNGGVPPSLVPVMFVAMGGSGGPPVNQGAILEWVQQHLQQQQQQSQQQQGQHPQLMAPQGAISPEQRRDSQPQGYAQYPSSVVPSTPGSAPSQSFGGYPASPRARGQSLSMGRPLGAAPAANPLSLNTGLPVGQSGPSTAISAHPAHPQSAPVQQEAQGSPIYFHHWQPPSTQASSSNQPATPSGESPKKRKATGPQPGPAPTQQRLRSPPPGPSSGSTISNPPPGRRRGHTRQRSDLSSYRPGPSRGGRAETAPRGGGGGGGSSSGETRSSEQQQPPMSHTHHAQAPQPTRVGAHSVSSLLSSDEPAHSAPYPPPSQHHPPRGVHTPHQQGDD